MENDKTPIWVGIVYPKDFYEKLKEFKGDSVIEFFSKPLTLALVAITSDEEKVVSLMKEIGENIVNPLNNKIVLMDDQEKAKEMRKIAETLRNGEFNINWYNWFMQMSCIIQDSGLKHHAVFFENKVNKDFSFVMVHFTTDVKLLDDEQKEKELIDYTRERFRNFLNNAEGKKKEEQK